MTKATFHLTALAAALSCSTALAQGVSPPSGSTATPTAGDEYVKLDKDKDGTISKKEASSNKSLTAKWDTLDANKDGKLDQAEFAQFETTPAKSTTPDAKDDMRY